MNRTHRKTLTREIRQSLGRFMSIFGIVALGVGFLAGLLSATPDMQAAVNRYYQAGNMADIVVKGTMGLTAADVAALRSVDRVADVFPLKVTDAMMQAADEELLATRIYGLPFEQADPYRINRLQLVQGRMPQASNECLVEQSGGFLTKLELGTTLTIPAEENADLADTYRVTEYTVVGVVSNPFYFSLERETSTVGNGRLAAIVYVDDSCYELDVYTEFLVRVAGTTGLPAFTAAYEDYVRPIADAIEDLGLDRSAARYAELYGEGKEELDQAKADLAEGESEAERELADAWQEILNGEQELADAKRKLAEGREDLADARVTLSEEEAEARQEISQAEQDLADALVKLQDGEQELADGLAELADGEREYADGREELRAGRTELNAAQAQSDAAEQQYQAGVAQLQQTAQQIADGEQQLDLAYDQLIAAGMDQAAAEASLAPERSALETARNQYAAGLAQSQAAGVQIEASRQQLAAGWEELNSGSRQLADARRELDQGHADAATARQELDDGWVEYNDGLAELAEARETLVKEIADANQEIAEAEADLAQGEIDYQEGLVELADGKSEYAEAAAEARAELADGAEKIADGERELADLEMPKWYVLDRNANVSYVSFAMNSEKVAAIATVFPIFFFLVAALVALTTMTRMVEEERTQIGTMKALGYSKWAIINKYLVYCGLASLLGSIVGLLAGVPLLAAVIRNAFSTVYHLPDMASRLNWPFAIIATGLALLCTLAATYAACSRVLQEKPATLMRPRAPQGGKRVFLERVGFIWSRLTFSYKATARNLIRQKKHFLMTVIGVAGCTAMIVTGFGLRDSVGSIANTQYTEIMQYDLLIELKENQSVDQPLNDWLAGGQVSDYAEVYGETGAAIADGQSPSVTIYVSASPASLERQIGFRERATGKALPFDDSAVIMTDKLADVLSLGVGDSFTLENADGGRASFKLTGITENYVGSYVYLNAGSYSAAFQSEPVRNTLLVRTAVSDTAAQDAVLTDLLESEAVLRAEFLSQTKESFDNLLGSINLVVVALIFAAGALAMIVLYNLLNINIEERRRELATLKVLGFHDEEVAGYVFRETLILCLIGTLVGLLLGKLLHSFVITVAENTDLMFGRTISRESFLLSAVITLVFSGLADLLMSGKLKRIAMVDSLKAID